MSSFIDVVLFVVVWSLGVTLLFFAWLNSPFFRKK